MKAAATAWAKQTKETHKGIQRIAVFGSYARGDWGVGSDLDLLIIVGESDLLFERRAAAFDATHLPVPADVLVYTRAEWEAMLASSSRFATDIEREALWL